MDPKQLLKNATNSNRLRTLGLLILAASTAKFWTPIAGALGIPAIAIYGLLSRYQGDPGSSGVQFRRQE